MLNFSAVGMYVQAGLRKVCNSLLFPFLGSPNLWVAGVNPRIILALPFAYLKNYNLMFSVVIKLVSELWVLNQWTSVVCCHTCEVGP